MLLHDTSSNQLVETTILSTDFSQSAVLQRVLHPVSRRRDDQSARHRKNSVALLPERQDLGTIHETDGTTIRDAPLHVNTRDAPLPPTTGSAPRPLDVGPRCDTLVIGLLLVNAIEAHVAIRLRLEAHASALGQKEFPLCTNKAIGTWQNKPSAPNAMAGMLPRF
jgi:hypothetical protein